jgi:hypothetical protein
MKRITIRENNKNVPQWWRNFYNDCVLQSNDFRGVSRDYYIGEQVSKAGGVWVISDIHYSSMWLDFCKDSNATWFIIKWS